MQYALLSLELFLAAAIIVLVLLQRSEGGALGMGGGSGSLISGRGAADALARLTTLAGVAFLAVALGLSVMAGWNSRQKERSIDLSGSGFTAPLAPRDAAAAAPAPVESEPAQAPPSDAQSALTAAPIEAGAVAPAPVGAERYAAPISSPPPAPATRSQTAAAQGLRPTTGQPRQSAPPPSRPVGTAGPVAASAKTDQTVTAPPTSPTPATQPVSRRRPQPPATTPPESIQIETPAPPIERSRSGPDQ